MSNIVRTTTEFAAYMAAGYMKEGGVFIDATCGNGHDTLRLAKARPSKLYAFDIQACAIGSTRRLLLSNGFGNDLEDGRIELICDSHENMSSYVTAPADVIVFNLGYLPGGSRDITSAESSTLPAFIASLELLGENGLICMSMYSGHEAGRLEKAALLETAKNLDPRSFHVAYISMINQHRDPPEILLVTKSASPGADGR